MVLTVGETVDQRQPLFNRGVGRDYPAALLRWSQSKAESGRQWLLTAAMGTQLVPFDMVYVWNSGQYVRC